MSVASRRVTIVNERGLHARASRAFVVEAIKFKSSVTVRREELIVDQAGFRDRVTNWPRGACHRAALRADLLARNDD